MLLLIAPLFTREKNVYKLNIATRCYAVLAALLCTIDIRLEKSWLAGESFDKAMVFSAEEAMTHAYTQGITILVFLRVRQGRVQAASVMWPSVRNDMVWMA